jgi:hypothetical protein
MACTYGAVGTMVAVMLVVVWMFYMCVTPSDPYSQGDPRLAHPCPECGCPEITQCGHHD